MTRPGMRAVIPAQAGIRSTLPWTPACAGVTGGIHVIPANAGIQSTFTWTPAFAGVTTTLAARG